MADQNQYSDDQTQEDQGQKGGQAGNTGAMTPDEPESTDDLAE